MRGDRFDPPHDATTAWDAQTSNPRCLEVMRFGWTLAGIALAVAVVGWALPAPEEPLPPRVAQSTHATTWAAAIAQVISPSLTPAAGFRSITLDDPTFASVAAWVPPRGETSTEVVLLLHGNQPGASDPSWMIGFHDEPAFAHRLLIAPGLHGADYEWTRPETVAALSALLRRITAAAGSSSPTYVAGYSAGASRALAVAASLQRPIAGVIAIAGDVMRPFRGATPWPPSLEGVPVLLVCMTEDEGPQTRCALNESNRNALLAHGVRDVEMHRLPGDHAFDRAAVANVIGEWLRRH